MEDTREVYHRPYDARQSVAPGHHTAQHGPEYIRGRVAQLFVVTEPLRGWRHVTVGGQRTRPAFADCIKMLVDGHDPDAERIVLVMDHRAISTASLRCMRRFLPPRRSGWSRS